MAGGARNVLRMADGMWRVALARMGAHARQVPGACLACEYLVVGERFLV